MCAESLLRCAIQKNLIVIMQKEGVKMIRPVTSGDQEQILSLMKVVKDDFAGYKEKEFLEAVYQAIDHKAAFLEEEDGKITGMILFSKAEKELFFLAVHPYCRKRGVAKGLIMKMKECFTNGDTIRVITFREGDPKGIPARMCYHACGFVDDVELTVFEYPCQKLILRL